MVGVPREPMYNYLESFMNVITLAQTVKLKVQTISAGGNTRLSPSMGIGKYTVATTESSVVILLFRSEENRISYWELDRSKQRSCCSQCVLERRSFDVLQYCQEFSIFFSAGSVRRRNNGGGFRQSP